MRAGLHFGPVVSFASISGARNLWSATELRFGADPGTKDNGTLVLRVCLLFIRSPLPTAYGKFQTSVGSARPCRSELWPRVLGGPACHEPSEEEQRRGASRVY
jgi:hypothetical protein